jgi:dipeptidase D
MTKPQGYPQDNTGIWHRFYELTQVPRPSKKEEKACEYLINFAKEKNIEFKVDSVSNIVMYVPATKGYEEKETVIIQNHVDMVCDKTPDKEFNFDEDAIDLLVENGWVTADRTTLGADNGIGCAAALALLDADIPHPPLELLFTMDEETGLNGALGLDGSLFKGTKLINLDTEEWGSIYIGCAGGIDYNINGNFELESTSGEVSTFKLLLGNLAGGHSGIDIHRNRANAIKLLSEFLFEARSLGICLAEFSGGKAHNIIPRDAYALITIPKENISRLEILITEKINDFKSFLNDEDQKMTLELEAWPYTPDKVLKESQFDKFIQMASLFPHGACGYNWKSDEPLVTHSNNMAIVKIKAGELYINTSLRFFDRKEVISLEHKVISIAKSFSHSIEKGTEYPSWKPIFESKLLDVAKDVYRETFKGELEVKAIHAGLECGILKEKLGEMNAISIGPNITGAHSPSESLEIKSTNDFWNFFRAILAVV